jgi:hypothetical protein
MKFSKKMLLVPFSQTLQDPKQKYLLDLDEEMNNILLDKSKSVDEKIKLYNSTLAMFISKKENFDKNSRSEDLESLHRIVNNLKDSNVTYSDLIENPNKKRKIEAVPLKKKTKTKKSEKSKPTPESTAIPFSIENPSNAEETNMDISILYNNSSDYSSDF